MNNNSLLEKVIQFGGADFVAPYINRLDNIIDDRTKVVSGIVNRLELYGMACKLLISHPMTDAAIAGFERDWKGVYGEKTIKDF